MGFGKILPHKKNLSQLLLVGGVGYDQWQVADDVGFVPVGPSSYRQEHCRNGHTQRGEVETR
jgi:hypothetical protein